MDLYFYLREGVFLVKAMRITAVLTIGAGVIGTVLAAFLALMRLSGSKIVSKAAAGYVEFMRGTPLLVQLFFIYFGAPQLGIELDPLPAGVIALGLNGGAYISEIFRGAILSIPKGQMEAARSLGMGHWLSMRRIVMPQAVRHAVPALGSSFAALIKDTSLVSVITVSELLLTAQQRVSVTFRPVEIFLMVGILYLLMTTVITYSVRWWEHRYKWSI